MKRAVSVAIVLAGCAALPAALGACGQKGPLLLPGAASAPAGSAASGPRTGSALAPVPVAR